MEEPAFEVIGTASGVAPGGTASVPWTNLGANQPYQWFVTASEGTHQISSDVWKFTTTINVAPVAHEQAVITREDTALSITLTATDENGDLPSYAVLTGPSHGSLTGTAPNLTYIPYDDYYGIDSFAFQANNGEVNSRTATVSITIHPINDPPLCMNVNLQTQSNMVEQVDPACTDTDGGALSYFIVDQPGYGTASVVDGKLAYVSQTNYSGPDSFTYKSNDGAADGNIGIVNVTVSPVNEQPPATESQTVTTSEDMVPDSR
jgi:hypothetical protein